MGKYTATLRLLGGARRGEGEGRGILCRHAHSLLYTDVVLSGPVRHGCAYVTKLKCRLAGFPDCDNSVRFRLSAIAC